MRALLLGIATLAVILPAPAAADSRRDGRHSAHHSAGPGGGFVDGERRRHRDRDDGFVYDYYREYQGDTAWKSDSFNDWWHDRPDRAYPRWMATNQNCDRQWYAGSTLRC